MVNQRQVSNNLAEQLKQLLGPYGQSFEYVTFERQVEREEGALEVQAPLLAHDYSLITPGGLRYTAGRTSSKDRNPLFEPVVARGLAYDHGKYWQWYLADSDFQSAFQNLVLGVQDANWSISYNNPLPSWAKAEAKRRLSFVRAVFDVHGPEFHQLILEACYQCVTGFALHEKVWRTDGGCDLEFIYPWQVQGWITDKSERKVRAVRCLGAQEPVPYSKLIHWRFNALGNDFEGNSLLRHIGLLIELKQQLLSNYGISHYAFGVPWVMLERSEVKVGNANIPDDPMILQLISSAQAKQRPVFRLAAGYKAVLLSPTGSIPDPLPMLNYLDSKIATMLKNEGTLIGQNAVGAYNLAEQKDFESLRNVRRWGKIISMGLAPLLKEIELRRFGSLIAPNTSPRLQVLVDEVEED